MGRRISLHLARHARREGAKTTEPQAVVSRADEDRIG